MDSVNLLAGQLGMWPVWANVFLTQLGLPLPAAPALLVAGAFAAEDPLTFFTLIAGSTVASLAADTLWYFAGNRYGHVLLDRIGRLAGRDAGYAQRVESSLLRWGPGLLVLGKFIPGVALFAPPIAGVARVRPVVFLAADGLGAALWALLPMALGAARPELVQHSVAAIGQYGGHIGFLLVFGAIATLALLWTRVRASPAVQRRPHESEKPAWAGDLGIELANPDPKPHRSSCPGQTDLAGTPPLFRFGAVVGKAVFSRGPHLGHVRVCPGPTLAGHTLPRPGVFDRGRGDACATAADLP
jgi:membrane protein DedA with SNARE-associated domain